MTGWNMPPGVSESDIPGNRPEDLAVENLINEIDGLIAAAMDAGMGRYDVVEMLRYMAEDYDTGMPELRV